MAVLGLGKVFEDSEDVSAYGRRPRRRIEAAPEVTAYDQISRIVTALGCRLVIEEPPSHRVADGLE